MCTPFGFQVCKRLWNVLTVLAADQILDRLKTERRVHIRRGSSSCRGAVVGRDKDDRDWVEKGFVRGDRSGKAECEEDDAVDSKSRQ